MKYKRIFLLVMDSVGIGSDINSSFYDDEGANTLLHISNNVSNLDLPTLNSLGLDDLIHLKDTFKVNHPHSYCMRLNESSIGKDTLTGHYEMMGIKTTKPFKTFTDTGFPQELINELEARTGHKIIGNIAASGTEIIKELGERQMKENSLIVYTSSDSVLQIAAHEEITGLDELYRCAQVARDLCLKDEWKVARVIARPYIGDNKSNFIRTSNRHDYALKPPHKTVLNLLEENELEVISIGKIKDIFNGYGISKAYKSKNNSDGMRLVNEVASNGFKGLCFVNLVDFDSEYGHRRNVIGYKNALETFDKELCSLIDILKEDDLLLISADHGNDPTWKGSDHTREKVPLFIYSKSIKNGIYLEERSSFADIGATILANYQIDKPNNLVGKVIEEVI